MQTSVSIVNQERAKGAVRLYCGWYGCSILARHGHTGRRYSMRDLNHAMSRMRNMVNPYDSPSGEARLRGLVMVMRIEDGGASECRTVMVGIRVATLPGAKAGRLPPGCASRESVANRPNRISR